MQRDLPPGFGALELIHEGVHGQVLVGELTSDGPRRIIVKRPRPGAAPRVAERLATELRLSRDLEPCGVRRALHATTVHDTPALVLEHVVGVPLAQAFAGRDRPLAEVLDVGLACARVVASLHAQQLVHRCLAPHHLLLGADLTVTLIDLSCAARCPPGSSVPATPDGCESALPWLAPEQTGRMNRPVDARADLYSLGAVLYELFAGRPPFLARDPAALVHCHLAREPVPITELAPSVPPVVADIVARLLAKDPAERYPSAAEVVVDLERCVSALRLDGAIDPALLAQPDRDRRRLGQRLYGRGAELEALRERLARTSAGARELVLVTGRSGIGKTALIEALQREAPARAGLLLRGKADPQDGSGPLAVWLQVLSAFVRRALTEDESTLERWRQRLAAGLGDLGAALTTALPELTLVLGPQQPLPDLPPAAARDLLDRAFRELVRVLATTQSPLVLFLDDLQWLDPASLRLLDALVGDPRLASCLIVGAYRGEEVEADHPLRAWLARLDRDGLSGTVLELGGLPERDVRQMLADAFRREDAEVGELATLVSTRTDGNPLFIRELLETLQRDGLIGAARRWDLERVRQAPLHADLAALVAQRVSGLPPDTLAVLRVAACLGTELDVGLTARVVGTPPDVLAASLLPAVRNGSLTSVGRHGRFTHDKVREAVLDGLTPDERRAVHHRIAQTLLAEGAAGSDDGLMLTARQLVAAGEELSAPEQQAAFDLLLRAARRARAAAAFHAASRFFSAAAGLTAAREAPRDVMLALHTAWAEAACLAGDYEAAERLMATALGLASSLTERVRVHQIQAEFYQTTMRFPEFVGLLLQTLAEVAVPALPPTAVQRAAIDAELARFRTNVANHPLDTLRELDEAPPSDAAVQRLLASALTLFWLAFPASATYYGLLAANLTLERGRSPATPLCLAIAGLQLCSAEGEIDLGHAVGEAALRLAERSDDTYDRPYVELLYASFVSYWKHPLRAGPPRMLQAFRRAAAAGSHLHAAFCLNNYIGNDFMCTEDLRSVVAAQDALEDAYYDLKQVGTYSTWRVFRQLTANLVQGAPNAARLSGRYFDEERDLAPLLAAKYDAAVAVAWFAMLFARCVMGDYAAADELLGREGAEALLERSAVGVFSYHVTAFLVALVHLQRCGADAQGRAERLTRARAIHARLTGYATHSPMNFLPLARLLDAELARVEGDLAGAIDGYQHAAESAREHRFAQLEALAEELAGKLWLERGHDAYARLHLARARRCWRRWGATARVVALDAQHPGWFADDEADEAPSLDVQAVTEVSRALASEVELERLLGRILSAAVENAGARRGLLLEVREGGLHIVAEATVGAQAGTDAVTTTVASPRPVAPTEAAQSVLHLALHTSHPVVLDEAWRDPTHGADPYVLTRRTKSLLCLPIANQGRPLGLLYLENDLATHVFTPSRLELLKIVASQAAISLQNARLFSRLEQQVSELQRTEAELRAANERFASILRAATGYAIIATDETGVVSLFNEGAEQLLGYRAEEVVGKVTPLSFHDAAEVERRAREVGVNPGFDALVADARRGGTDAGEWLHVRKDGTRITVSLSVAATRDAAGRTSGFIGVVRDVTQQRRLERQLRLSQKMESVGLLAGGVAHDLNNLLTPILGYAELLEGEPLDADLREGVEVIRESAERARDLTRQLLAFGRRQVIDLQPLDLRGVVANLQKVLRRTIRENIKVQLILPPTLRTVKADLGQIEQVLVNLAVNAQDAMLDGGVLTIELADVELDAIARETHPSARAGRFVSLTVTDTGAGMDAETAARAFDPFFTTKEPGRGTGLGLATVHGIVEQHGGTIHLYSEPGRGSAFKVLLPAVEDAPLDQARAAPEALARGDERLLVVEDDAVVRRLLCRLLRELGYHVVEAADVAHCLALAEAATAPFDLLVTDVIMPGLDGRQVFERLRAAHPALRVLYVSGYSANALGNDGALDEGVVLLEKPFSLLSLSSKVRRALGH